MNTGTVLALVGALAGDLTIPIPSGSDPTTAIRQAQASLDLACHHLTFQLSGIYSSGISMRGPFVGACDGADSVTITGGIVRPTSGYAVSVTDFAAVHLVGIQFDQSQNFSNLTSANGGHGQDMMNLSNHATVHADRLTFGASGGGNFNDMTIVNSEVDFDSCVPSQKYCGYDIERAGGFAQAHILCDGCRIQYGSADGSSGQKTWVYWNGIANYAATVIIINGGVIEGAGQTFNNDTTSNMRGPQCSIRTNGILFTGNPSPNLFGAPLDASCRPESGGQIE